MNNNKNYLTIKEASKLLNLKESRLRTAVLKKEIPYFKIGHLIRITEEDLISWIESGLVYPERINNEG